VTIRLKRRTWETISGSISLTLVRGLPAIKGRVAEQPDQDHHIGAQIPGAPGICAPK
jgi:hypothetical protein